MTPLKPQVVSKLPGLTMGGQALAYSPSGDRLVYAGGDPLSGSVREVVCWDPSGSLVWEYKERGCRIQDTAFSPDGRRLLCAEQDGPYVIELDAATGKKARRIEAHKGNAVHGVAYAPGGSEFATASWDMTVKVWPAAGSAPRLTLKADENSYSSVRFSPDGRLIAAGSAGALTVWAADSGRLLHDGPGASTIAFHPDGSHVLAVGEGAKGKGVIRAVGTAKWKSLWTRPAHKRACTSVAYAPHGQLLATAGDDKQILLWDAAGKQVAKLKDHILSEFGVVGLAWSPDGTRLACTDDRGFRQPGQVTVYAVEGG